MSQPNDSPTGRNRDERHDDLVRPYVKDPGNNDSGPFDIDGAGSEPDDGFIPFPEEVGARAFSLPESAPPPERGTAAAADPPGGQHRAGGPAGRHRRFPAAARPGLLATAASRRVATIGAVAAMALAGAVLLSLPGHRSGTLPPVTAPAPATAPATASPDGITSFALASAGQAPAREHARYTTMPATAVTRTATHASSAAAPAPLATAAAARRTPSPAAATATAPRTVSIQATTPCCRSFYIRHDDRDNRIVITQITSGSAAAVKADATWIVRAGLADASCVSFESANDPGDYLRHFDFELYLDPDDGSSQFAQDSTFCPRAGNSGQGYSLQSVNYPYKFIRHYDYVVYIASDGGTNPWDASALWPDDTTWLIGQPWG